MTMNDELFPTMEPTKEKADFKTNVYLKPKQDFRMYNPREMRITMAKETCSIFVLPNQKMGCSSWDRITGFDRNTREVKECEDCPYRIRRDHKGLTIVENGKEVVYKCVNNYALFMEHPDADKQYVLTSVNFRVYDTFDKYRQSLLAKGLDVPEVITKITRVEPEEGNGYAYTFEFVKEINLEISEAEMLLMDEMKGAIPEVESEIEGAGMLKDVAKSRGIDLDINRARRLVATMGYEYTR